MLSKGSDVISISLSDDLLKIVQLKGAGSSAKVGNVVSRSVSGVSADDLPKLIQSALSGFNTKKSEVVSVIPSSMVSTKKIEIPSVNPEEIKSIVNLQAGRHTPFSRDEIQIGYINIGVYKENYTKVLLVIANRKELKVQLDAFAKAGLKVKRVLFAPEGITSLYSSTLKLAKEPAPAGIIDIGNNSTDFIITFNGLAITTRNIPIGRTQISSEGESALSRLVEELAKTLESYQGEDSDQPPAQYFLTNDDDQNKLVQAALGEKLNWQVQIASYVDHIKASGGVLKQIAADAAGASFLDVIAAGSACRGAQVDLIPDEFQLQKSIEDQGKEVFRMAIQGFVLLVLVGLTLGLKIYFQTNFLTKLQSDYQENRKKVEHLENISNTSRIVQNYLSSRMISLDTINELYKSIPDEIYLTSLLMDEEGNVSIQGISDIASLVFNLGTSLKESEYFKSVNIKSTTAKKDRGKDVSAFEITLKLQSAADDEAAAAAEAEAKKE